MDGKLCVVFYKGENEATHFWNYYMMKKREEGFVLFSRMPIKHAIPRHLGSNDAFAVEWRGINYRIFVGDSRKNLARNKLLLVTCDTS